jgi:hypothetical protein
MTKTQFYVLVGLSSAWLLSSAGLYIFLGKKISRLLDSLASRRGL